MDRALWKARRINQGLSRKDAALGEFVYGTGIFEDNVNTWLLSHDSTRALAYGFDNYIVEPSTLCQCTGIPDADEKLIFEGDWWTENFGGWADSYMVVQYDEEKAAFVVLEYAGVSPDNYDSSDWEVRSLDDYHTIRIMGNIHDGKEKL